MPPDSDHRLQFYNTLTGRKEAFAPLHGKRVTLFVCGPTVYDVPHIGHARTYAAFDVLARWLRRRYEVFFIVNVTDIDDKIIHRAKEAGLPPEAVADTFTRDFLDLMREMGVETVNLYCKCTAYVAELIAQIEGLIARGAAYASGGDVYFSIRAFPEFGKLSRNVPADLVAGARVEPGEKKRAPEDFALWKSAKPGEPWWPSPWGRGRPGWHIEDTAIAMHHFGEQYDIHGGGRDLVFPHHDAEIAIAESLSGKKPYARYWLHSGLITIGGQKMSKSLGNFVSLRQLLERFGAPTLRLYFASTHYRSPLDFDEERVAEAHRARDRLEQFHWALAGALKRAPKRGGSDAKLTAATTAFETRFGAAMDDDLNTPEALAALHNFVRAANPLLESAGSSALEAARRAFAGALEAFGVEFGEAAAPATAASAELLVDLLVRVRERVRAKGLYDLSDEIRKEMETLGFKIEDTPKGTKRRPK